MSTRFHLKKWRLSDAMDYQLHQLSYPIEIPLCASPALWSPSKTFPEIGKVFFGLENRYGPSSKRFDWYKQSFCFPFLVRASVSGEETHFHMSIMDWKGALDFRFRQMQERIEDFYPFSNLIHAFSVEAPRTLTPMVLNSPPNQHPSVLLNRQILPRFSKMLILKRPALLRSDPAQLLNSTFHSTRLDADALTCLLLS